MRKPKYGALDEAMERAGAMIKKATRRGNCYVACEALYHLLGGEAAGLTPHTLRHEGDVHWYLVKRVTTRDGYQRVIIDPTVSQFERRPDYDRGRGRGFLTKEPSARARALMEKLVWQ